MIVVDAHQDIAYNALNLKRDYTRSALEKRRLERGKGWPVPVLGLPDALLGRVGVVFATLFVAPASSQWSAPWDEPRYTTPEEAHRYAMQQLDYYHRLADSDDRIALIRDQSDLDEVLATWEEGTETKDHKQGLVILMEGADPVVEPTRFEEWYERGVRLVGTAWTQTRYSGGTGAPGPLTELGHELLDVLADYNAILDLSHMSEQAFLQSLDRYEGPIIASHSNPRSFYDSDRNLSDEMIRRLADRDGVMGIVLFNRFLSDSWHRGDAPVPLSVVVEAIDYVCQLTGHIRHVGIGSDFDGGFGAESTPEGLDTVTDLWNLGTALRERGYSDADIEAVLGGNMLRKLRQSLRA